MGGTRTLNPHHIGVPARYKIEVFAEGLTAPISLVFTDNREMLVADAGIADGNGKVLRHTSDGFVVIGEGFKPPLTGISYHQRDIYVSHRGTITVLKPDGEKQDVLYGLPSWGDHHNNQVAFGPDGKMYFGQGTATNSGVVGEDNDWVKKYPFFHDYPGRSIRLAGDNFVTSDLRVPKSTGERAYTGAYSPFGVPSRPTERVRGITAASGSILRANPDGSGLEQVAWGLRNPFRIRFDRRNQLYASNHGMDERGSRPVSNSPDELQLIRPGMWYGFPDFSGGLPVTLPQFRADGKRPSFLLARHPMIPPNPVAVFPPHSAAMGFDFNYNSEFGPLGHVYVAEFGPGRPGSKPISGLGHRVSRIDLATGRVQPFAVNRSGHRATFTGDGGFERPIDVVFGSEGDMYVVDMGISKGGEGFVPNSGVIWRIHRT